ncbi:hypothetical protein SCHPADRAFT_908196 [Schizopora paradoxa]|uniref:Uncharacterized protein n=1 Tax=Schizopora paradoxa TaxID=27342 RepID=A0A0H2RBY0_9AGAM|nr:hypothetical protein SCHPADRAFT_908196 [Schizopora paradoxa]
MSVHWQILGFWGMFSEEKGAINWHTTRSLFSHVVGKIAVSIYALRASPGILARNILIGFYIWYLFICVFC